MRHHRQEHDVKGGFKMVAQKKTDFQDNNYLQLSTITIYNHLQLPYNRYTINGWAQAFRVTGAFMGLVPFTGMCVLHMHMGRYDHPKWYWLFLDQSDFKDAVESQIRKANKRIGNCICRIQL